MGVIIEGEYRRKDKEHRLVIRCANHRLLTAYVPLDTDIETVLGEIVLVSYSELKMICISLDWTIGFLQEATPPDPPYIVGALYRHSTFGIGKLLAIQKLGEDYRLTINFARDGVKNLVASYANLSILDTKESPA